MVSLRLTCHKSGSHPLRVAHTEQEPSLRSQSHGTKMALERRWRIILQLESTRGIFFFYLLSDTWSTYQTGAELFFFFEMCNSVKLLWFQIYTEIWNHLVFIQTNSN